MYERKWKLYTNVMVSIEHMTTSRYPHPFVRDGCHLYVLVLNGVLWCTLCMRTFSTQLCDCMYGWSECKSNASVQSVQGHAHIDIIERIEPVLGLEPPHLSNRYGNHHWFYQWHRGRFHSNPLNANANVFMLLCLCFMEFHIVWDFFANSYEAIPLRRREKSKINDMK